MRKAMRLYPVRACGCALALLSLLAAGSALAQSRPEQQVFPNLDLTVPDTTGTSNRNGLYGSSGVDNSRITSPVEPVASSQGLFIGNSRSGDGQYFLYGETVERSDERTGQREAPSRKIGIRVNTDLQNR